MRRSSEEWKCVTGTLGVGLFISDERDDDGWQSCGWRKNRMNAQIRFCAIASGSNGGSTIDLDLFTSQVLLVVTISTMASCCAYK